MSYFYIKNLHNKGLIHIAGDIDIWAHPSNLYATLRPNLNTDVAIEIERIIEKLKNEIKIIFKDTNIKSLLECESEKLENILKKENSKFIEEMESMKQKMQETGEIKELLAGIQIKLEKQTLEFGGKLNQIKEETSATAGAASVAAIASSITAVKSIHDWFKGK